MGAKETGQEYAQMRAFPLSLVDNEHISLRMTLERKQRGDATLGRRDRPRAQKISRTQGCIGFFIKGDEEANVDGAVALTERMNESWQATAMLYRSKESNLRNSPIGGADDPFS